MSNSKQCDALYGVKPRNVALQSEEIPRLPAKKPRGYCKRRKGEHVFTLVDVSTSLQAGGQAMRVVGWIDHKEYRCHACGKKHWIDQEFALDKPIKREQVSA